MGGGERSVREEGGGGTFSAVFIVEISGTLVWGSGSESMLH